MPFQATCPQCGSEIVFSLGASLLKICEHCGSAVARKGAKLADYGKVADLVSTPSLLSLGLKGGYQGAPPFTLLGRLQMSFGSGTWDEWLLGFRDGNWAWLSESQGKFHYMGQAPLPPVPSFEDLRVGETIDLGSEGTFVVTESRAGTFVSGAGELPFDVAPGSPMNYADLQGPGGKFATIDYGTGQSAEAVYIGREVTLDDLGIQGAKTEPAPRAAAKGEALACPQCGGPLELRAPDQTQRIACPYCGSLLDATKDLKVLEVLTSVEVEPLFPLGAKGRLMGVQWTFIGFMERSVTVEYVRYAWREYLLHDTRKGFRWLVESKGHWSFVEPIHAGDARASIGDAFYQGESFKHFQSGEARVDSVLGEFYWEVARGDTAMSHDYVAPPRMLSTEETHSETTYSLATYLEPEQVWKAFNPPGKPPERTGVAPNQPWAHAAEAGSVLKTSLALVALVILLFVGVSITGGRTVFSKSFTIPNRVLPGSPEAALFSDPFSIESSGNVEVRLEAPVNNSFLYLDGALINEKTGDVDEFDAEVAFYAGVEDGEFWSEGGTHARAYVGRVPAGTYVMRLAPQWPVGQAPSGYTVTLRSRVPRLYLAVIALALILAWPLVLYWRKMRFESQRWSESDHPWMSSSGDEDE